MSKELDPLSMPTMLLVLKMSWRGNSLEHSMLVGADWGPTFAGIQAVEGHLSASVEMVAASNLYKSETPSGYMLASTVHQYSTSLNTRLPGTRVFRLLISRRRYLEDSFLAPLSGRIELAFLLRCVPLHS